MRILRLAVAALLTALSLCTPARSQTMGVPYVPIGYCQILAATLASSTGLSACAGGIPTGATAILMQAEAQNIRWRDDKTAPTTTVGMILLSGQPPALYNGTLANLLFIDAVAGGILNVTFIRNP